MRKARIAIRWANVWFQVRGPDGFELGLGWYLMLTTLIGGVVALVSGKRKR